MYSYEIQKELDQCGYVLSSCKYISIILSSPQVDHVKYSPYGDYYEAWTNDGFYWKFSLSKIE